MLMRPKAVTHPCLEVLIYPHGIEKRNLFNQDEMISLAAMVIECVFSEVVRTGWHSAFPWGERHQCQNSILLPGDFRNQLLTMMTVLNYESQQYWVRHV